jgi:hypothetical protein
LLRRETVYTSRLTGVAGRAAGGSKEKLTP